MQRSTSASNMKPTVDFHGEPIVCGGRSKKAWKHLGLFYFVFWGLLVALFAICFAVMFYTLPETDSNKGPKSQYIIKPGVAFFPSSISKGGLCSADPQTFRDVNLRSYKRAVTSFFNRAANTEDFLSRRPLRLNTQTPANASELDITQFGPCNTLENVIALAEQGQVCFFGKLNRVFGFKPKQDVAVSTRLEFPSEAAFTSRHNETFANVVSVSPSVIPASQFPFRNKPNDFTGTTDQPIPFVDAVAAVLVDVNTIFKNCTTGNEPKININIDLLFNWGQGPEEGEGRGIFEFDFNY